MPKKTSTTNIIFADNFGDNNEGVQPAGWQSGGITVSNPAITPAGDNPRANYIAGTGTSEYNFTSENAQDVKGVITARTDATNKSMLLFLGNSNIVTNLSIGIVGFSTAGKFQYYNGVTLTDTGVAYSANIDYRFEVTCIRNAVSQKYATFDFAIYNTAGTVLASGSAIPAYNALQTAVSWTILRAATSGGKLYVDKVQISKLIDDSTYPAQSNNELSFTLKSDGGTGKIDFSEITRTITTGTAYFDYSLDNGATWAGVSYTLAQMQSLQDQIYETAFILKIWGMNRITGLTDISITYNLDITPPVIILQAVQSLQEAGKITVNVMFKATDNIQVDFSYFYIQLNEGDTYHLIKNTSTGLYELNTNLGAGSYAKCGNSRDGTGYSPLNCFTIINNEALDNQLFMPFSEGDTIKVKGKSVDTNGNESDEIEEDETLIFAMGGAKKMFDNGLN